MSSATCPVCYEAFSTEEGNNLIPHQLPCNDIICQGCISSNIFHGKYYCPECGVECKQGESAGDIIGVPITPEAAANYISSVTATSKDSSFSKSKQTGANDIIRPITSKLSPNTIILVCTSNTCRSPMAEYLARQWFINNKTENSHNFTVISRALSDRYEPPGSPASENGVIIMKEDFGIDMSSHRSALLRQTDVDEAVAIIGVSQGHIEFIRSNFLFHSEEAVNVNNKLFAMKRDVRDPWHAHIEVYRACAHQLAELIPLQLSEMFGEQSCSSK